MSDNTKITATPRTDFGKGASRRDRREGFVPVVLYGHGTEPRHFKVNTLEFAAILREHGTNVVLELDINGQEQLALTKQVDIDPLKRTIDHADLLVVKKGEKVTVDIAVHIVGNPAPGTLVTQDASEIAIEAEAMHIPEHIEVSIDGAEVGTQITAADLTLPQGVSLIAEPDTLIVNIVEAPSAEELDAETDGEAAGAAGDAKADEAAGGDA